MNIFLAVELGLELEGLKVYGDLKMALAALVKR
jgi:hypothetical protein